MQQLLLLDLARPAFCRFMSAGVLTTTHKPTTTASPSALSFDKSLRLHERVGKCYVQVSNPGSSHCALNTSPCIACSRQHTSSGRSEIWREQSRARKTTV
eukprot:33467-Amphidinium_carterae.1